MTLAAPLTDRVELTLYRASHLLRPKSDAIVLFDERGNTEQAKLWPMEHCLFDFRLKDEGRSCWP